MVSDFLAPSKKRRSVPALAAGAIFVIVVGIVFGIRFLPRPAPTTSGAVGSLMPDFAMQLRKGNMMRLSEFSGRPIVMLFWTSWTPSIQEEFTALQQAYAERDGGFTAVAVHRTRMELWSTAETFGEASGVTFPILSDPTDEVYRTFVEDGHSMPVRVFIDRGGVIRAKESGPISIDVLRRGVEALLR